MKDNAFIREYNIPPFNESSAPLSGYKFAVKDFVSVKDQPVSFGLFPPLIEKAQGNAAIIDLLLSSGAELIGSTNMDPAAISIRGKSPFYGDMNNPADKSRPLGGSSGGSAIAVFSGMADFALGSDHGGSVRLPASMCGLCGLKLSRDFTNVEGCILLEDLDSPGIIAKSPAVIKNVLSAISPKNINKDISGDILIPLASDLNECDEKTVTTFYKISGLISDSFKVIRLSGEIDFSQISRIRKLLTARYFYNLYKKYEQMTLTDDIKAVILYAKSISEDDFQNARIAQQEIKNSLVSIIGNNFLLTPLSPFQVNDSNLTNQNINLFMNAANIAGLPAINLNLEMPCQLIGPENSDFELCIIAEKVS